MKTNEFLDLLRNNATKELIFEYEAEQFVPKAYHITEVKNVSVESVDCGGRPHDYKETIVQLWVSGKELKLKHMLAGKALSIFETVNKVKPLSGDTEIFFEWGHKDLRTSNYKVTTIKNLEDKLIVQLFVPPTVCKPKFELSVLGQKSSCC